MRQVVYSSLNKPNAKKNNEVNDNVDMNELDDEIEAIGLIVEGSQNPIIMDDEINDDLVGSMFNAFDQQGSQSDFIDISDADDEWISSTSGKKKSKKLKNTLPKIGAKKEKGHKKSHSNEIITMSGNLPTDSFVIIEESGKGAYVFIKSLKYALLCLLFFAFIYITYFLLSFRIIPEEVKGAHINFYGISAISRDYRISLDEIKEGDIIVSSQSVDWSPLVYKYRFYKYQSHNGGIIFVSNLEGLNERIEQGDIAYIIRNKPRMMK